MKNQGLAFVPFVVLYFADEDDVIAAVILPHVAANEMRGGAFQQRAAAAPFSAFDIGEFVFEGSRELAREMMLVGRQTR